MADTLQGLKGLTFDKVLSPNPGTVGRLDRLRGTSLPVIDQYEDEPEARYRRTMRNVDEQSELLAQMAGGRPGRNARMASQRNALLSFDPSEEIGLEAAGAGYGESRFDKRMTTPAQLEDIEDSRARMQSGLGVLANSVAKMGVLAGTTAADSWIGLPAGIINLASEAVSGNISSGRDALNAIVDNPVSSYLQGINEKSENIFRNYQTAEERNRPWWENMFTANFIGDTIIKNAGFTIGAVVGGKAAVGVLGRMTGAKEARDAFKGLAAELGLTGKSASEVVEALAKGTTSLEKKAAVKALEESAKSLKNTELGLRIAGGLLAGTGEARIEALNGVSELEKAYEEIYGNLDLQRVNALNKVKNDIIAQGIDLGSPEGLALYDEKKGIIDQNFFALQEQIAHDKAMAANSIFALNVPLLTAGDMIQWGKLMLGGYALDRNLVKGITKQAEKTAIGEAARTPAEILKSTKYAVKGNKFTETLGKVGAASRNVLVEMQEEMNQSLFSATAKAKAMGDTTEFMERLYDPMAVHDTVTWLDAAKEGMRQSWLNKDDWVEGFAGGFMGFMGLPSISVRVNENTGKRVPRLTMEGGIWSPLREQSDLYKRREKLVETLNNRLGSPEFLNYYYGKIGNRHFDSIKEDAVKTGDKGLYEKADHAQLINDAMMFEKAGRLQDFIDIIDSFKNVSDETVDEIKKLFPNDAEVQKYTTSGMRTLINENVEKMSRRLDNYMKISDNIKTTFGSELSDPAAAELTWQTAHLDEIEHDLKSILAHPETSALLSMYKSENGDSIKNLTDYEIVSSGAYSTWLKNKYNDKKDATNKSDLAAAIRDAGDASYDMSERLKYIDNISLLSSDPELVMKKMDKIKRDRDRMVQERRTIGALMKMQSTDKLSEIISAMDEIEDADLTDGKAFNEVLAGIKKEADRGNKTAKEYLIVRDVESDLGEQIDRIGEKTQADPKEIQQAKDAWNYFKNTADTAYDLFSRHKPEDIAPNVADARALNILDGAIEAVLKSRKLFGKIQQRDAGTRGANTNGTNDGKKKRKYNTVGDGLTNKRFDEAASEIMSRTDVGAMLDPINGKFFFVLDLDRANVKWVKSQNPSTGKPELEDMDGIVYGYYRGFKDKSGNFTSPVLFDESGNEIDPKDVLRFVGPDGQSLPEWMNDDNFPVRSMTRKHVLNEKSKEMARKSLPIRKAPSKKVKKDTVGEEEGKDPGSKKNPHRFIAPNPDMSLLGADSQAVADLLRELPEDSEIRFGLEDKDGPIYILAGPANIKIGTLPRQDDGMDVYSGLSELDELIRKEYGESSDRKNADGMWISEKYVNHIREKEYSRFVPTEENVPIGNIPGFSGIKEPIVMLAYGENGSEYVFSNPNITIKDIVRRFGIEASTFKSGFSYLLVPSGKKYIPVMLYTQNVNNDTLDLKDPAQTASGFGKRISDTLDKVVDAITNPNEKERVAGFNKWALAKRGNGQDKVTSSPDSLQNLLYFRTAGKDKVQFFIKETCPNNPEWFGENTVMVINRQNEETKENDWTPINLGKKDADGNEISIRDQIIDAFNDFVYETESGEEHHGPIAQVQPSQFSDEKEVAQRIREWVDSDMLLANVKDFDLMMPSFIMDYWSVSQGKFIRPSHSPSKKKTGPSVSTRKTKTGGAQTIVEMELGGKPVKYNLTSNKIKIDDGKWMVPADATKADEAIVKKMGFKSFPLFVKTAKAVATIANKYGDRDSGDGRIGNRVLLSRFDAGKDIGFIIGDNGGTFMSPEELVKFKGELKAEKPKNAAEKKANEKSRVEEQKRIVVEEDEDDSAFQMEVESGTIAKRDEVARMSTINNVRGAIFALRKNVPEYRPFLDYISKIGYYDDVLVEFANIVDANNSGIVGQNRMRFRGGEFTNSIVIGRNSLGYHTLMHELVHAFTAVALRNDAELRDNIKTAMDYLRDSVGHTKLSNTLGANGMYAFRDVYEFASEFFSNPKLQELAKSIQMPETNNEKKESVFHRIINWIASLFRRGNKANTMYDKLNELLYSVVDRQVELQKSGKMIFKTQQEFNSAKSLASGARVDGVAFAMKIQNVDGDMTGRYVLPMDEDRSSGISELRSYPIDTVRPDIATLQLLQMFMPNDRYSSYEGARKLLSSDNVYEFSNGNGSSLIGVKDGEVFVTIRSLPVLGNNSYDSLIAAASDSKMPIIIAASPNEAEYYFNHGMHAVHGGIIDGKIYVANNAFTNDDLFRLGTTYRPFADVLDKSSEFEKYRRERYSDEEWAKFSEIEKDHARKCIGI